MSPASTAKGASLILGTAQLRGTYGAVGRPPTPRSDHEVAAFLQHAADLGFASIDTAPAYDDAETLIGEFGPSFAVHTKVDPELEPASSLRRSLERVRRPRVEVLYFHDPEIVTNDPLGYVERAHTLVGERVGALGASVYDMRELQAVIEDDRFAAVQIPMNLLDRRIDDTELSRASERGLQVFIRSVFLQGILLTPPELIPRNLSALTPSVASVRAAARDAGVSVAALALGWIKERPGIAGVVVGANSGQELNALADAWSGPALDESSLLRCATLPLPPRELLDPRNWPQRTLPIPASPCESS